MCNKCGSKSKCSCNPCDKELKDLKREVESLYQIIENMSSATKFLMGGHPIIAIEDADDISAFDTTSGKGSGRWTGWAICNGNTYPSPSGNIATPNLFDKFLTGAGGSYAVGDMGGVNMVTLLVSNMPAHSHTVTDPGHTHTLADPGHTHVATSTTHTHSGMVDVPVTTSVAKAALPASAAADAISVANANTGISMASAYTGISIASQGGGASHENRPPYHAVLFVKKIF